METSKKRSPKAPSIDLEEAIKAVKPVFEEETRNPMSREVLASHLGYSGLSGASTTKIGALRHFGLIVGREDALTVSDTAIDLLMSGPSTDAYKTAIRAACLSPVLYQEITEAFESQPSLANLKYWLVQRGVQNKASDRMANVFIESAKFADLWGAETVSTFSTEEKTEDEHLEESVAPVASHSSPLPTSTNTNTVSTHEHENEIASGMLSKETKFRLLVSGPLSERELDILIRKLELDKEILATS